MKKIKLAVNLILLPISISIIFIIVLIENPHSPVEFHGIGFNLKK